MMSRLLRAATVLTFLLLWTRTEAIPAFARKYGMSCAACHVGWPVLSQVGQNFRDNGYQFGLGKDDPVTISNAYVPLAIRSTGAYGYTKTTNQPSDDGPIDVKSGGVGSPGADILLAGTVARNLSYLVVAAGFTADEPASIESAWGRISNIAGTGWLNLKVGKFELDLPASSHRPVTMTADYAIYGAVPGGSHVAFNMGENQLGVEIDGHDENSSTRYALALVSPNEDPGSSGAWSSPLVYGHVQKSFELGNSVLPWVRLGILGAFGSLPTEFTTDGGEPIPGTGKANKQYSRVGADLSGTLGYPSTPFYFTAAYILGKEDEALAEDAPSGGNSFTGGFLEVNWVPWSDVAYNATPWLFFARYDTVRYKEGPGDFDGVTVGARRYLALGPRASMAVHAEVHSDKTKEIGADSAEGTPLDVESQSLMLGLDFAF
jgi:hypothetical protein